MRKQVEIANQWLSFLERDDFTGMSHDEDGDVKLVRNIQGGYEIVQIEDYLGTDA